MAMAKTYLEVCPDERILVVDSAASIGGTWAKERLYSGLKTNNLIGSYEFSDFPMIPEKYGCRPGQHIPGSVVHRYMCDAADYFDITSRVRLNTKIERARLQDDSSWIIDAVAIFNAAVAESNETNTIHAKRLVLATGTTSEPFRPTFKNESSFCGLIIHSKQLRERAEQLKAAKSVVVIGGNKSAFDVCYSAAQNGSKVHMVMRPSGGGPSYVWPAAFTWFRLDTSLAKLSCTRFASWFDPCIWASDNGGSWMQWLLHRTWIGRTITAAFWSLLRRRVEQLNGYETNDRMRMLKPWTSPYWMGNSLSTHNYEESWFHLASQGKITVHHADVESLSERTVCLSSGEVLDADALVCCTGWKAAPPIHFFPAHLPSRLALPGSLYKEDHRTLEADRFIFSQLPGLRLGPQKHIPMVPKPGHYQRSECQQEHGTAPYELYRFVVPTDPEFLHNRTIAFIGAHLSIQAVVLAQVQALWIAAFFQDLLPHMSIEDLDGAKLRGIHDSALLHAEFERIRHPPEAGGSGQRYPDLVFDSIPYVDLLLNDLGLNVRRKRTWLKHIFEPHGVRDYEGLVQDWQRTIDHMKERRLLNLKSRTLDTST